MSEKNTGGAAFARPVSRDGDEYVQPEHFPAQEGMTLRDYFAAKALAGMLSDLPKTMYGLEWQESVAHTAYELADAMLAERAK